MSRLTELKNASLSSTEAPNAPAAPLQTNLSAIAHAVHGLHAKLDALEALASAPDELKSLADVVRGCTDELFWVKTAMAKKADVDAMKTELRLIRSDLNALAKRLGGDRLTTVEARGS